MPKGVYIRTEAIRKSLSIAGKNRKIPTLQCDKCGYFKKEGHICPTKEELAERIKFTQTPEARKKSKETIIKMYKEGKIIPAWQGKKRDDSTKEKISETNKLLFKLGLCEMPELAKKARKGFRQNTGKTLFKKGIYAGKKHWNWKGGISSKKKKMWSSGDYQNWRKAVFQKDNYACQIKNCKKIDKETRILNAHHIKETYKYPELIFDVNNGQTLCLKHHKELHGLNKK
jgi:hypothetical protein